VFIFLGDIEENSKGCVFVETVYNQPPNVMKQAACSTLVAWYMECVFVRECLKSQVN